jgi:hypothetical protein
MLRFIFPSAGKHWNISKLKMFHSGVPKAIQKSSKNPQSFCELNGKSSASPKTSDFGPQLNASKQILPIRLDTIRTFGLCWSDYGRRR